MSLNERNTKNFSNEEKFQVKEKSFEGLVLKELPKHEKYAFIGEERFKPVILAADLILEKEQKVVKIMRKHHNDKNGGMTVIRNEKNELIPIRTVTG